MEAPNEQLYALQIAPQWVKEHAVDLSYEHETASPFYYLLTDYQDYIDRERTFSYTRTVQKINDASRLEDASLLVSELNEKHQRVFFHQVDIVRNGQRIDALDPENIAVYQRETSLESHVVTGRKTVALTIDDLRVGDVLDVRMTFCNFTSTHPLHGKYYLSTFWLSWSCPVVKQSVRVINSGHLSLLFQQGGANHTLGKVGKLVPGEEFYRQWEQLEPKVLGPQSPAWVWHNFLQFTTETTWREISKYLYHYYEANGVLDAAIDVSSIDLLELSGERSTDLLRVIRFVQNNVRYRGESHGIYTHTPKTPERTLKKRAGDCKDKSNLMVALLRSMGVDATLVLVSSRFGKKIAALTPSAYQFDHMIVKVREEEQIWYFDSTIQAQAGDFEHCAQLNYGHGLELTAQGCELTELPFDRSRCVLELEQNFDFQQFNTDAQLCIRRRYFYHRADNMRFYLNSKEQPTLLEDYLRGARETTGCHLEVLEPITVNDDTQRNVLETVERYRIVDLVQTHPHRFLQIPTEVSNELPVTLDTTVPLRLGMDGAIGETITVKTARAATVNVSDKQITNPYFNYHDAVTRSGVELCFKTNVVPLASYVKAGDIERYMKEVSEVRSRAVNNFTYDTSLFKADQKVASRIVLTLMLISFLVWIAVIS